MYKKQQIIQKISQISRQRSKLDELYVTLQKTISSYQQSSTTKSIVQMRQTFNQLTSQISIKIIQRTKQLDTLKFKSQKLTKQGQNMISQSRNIDSLKQYFIDLKHNLNTLKQKGQQFISQKEKWEIKVDNQHLTQQNMSLLNSHRTAKQTMEVADSMLSTLQYQQNILMRAKNRMGDVLKNINLAANITRMVKTRTKQDNKLILWLTVGLFVEIFVCLFVIKPMFKGQ